MKGWVADASIWTPELRTLSAEDGLGSLSRFSRTCAAVVERLTVPDEDVLVILGTSTAPAVPLPEVTQELQGRWPGCGLEFVIAGPQTLPLSGVDALVSVGLGRAVLWVVVDLKPGAELAAVVRLSPSATSTRLEIGRTDEVAPPVAEHLNSCAPILSLFESVGQESVSIKVGSWVLTVAPTV